MRSQCRVGLCMTPYRALATSKVSYCVLLRTADAGVALLTLQSFDSSVHQCLNLLGVLLH